MARVRNIFILSSCDVFRPLERRVYLMALLVGVGFSLIFARTAMAQESPRTSPATSSKRAGEEKAAPRARRVGPREDAWVRMNEVEKEEFEQFVEKSFIEVWAELRAYKTDRPRVYRQWMIDLAPQLVPLMEETSRNPARAVLSIEVVRVDFLIRRLVSEYLLEKDKTKHAKLEQRITEAVTARFDARQQRRWLDMTSLEERLRRQKELHKEKNRNRERLIRREVSAILNPAGSSNGPGEPSESDENDGAKKPG